MIILTQICIQAYSTPYTRRIILFVELKFNISSSLCVSLRTSINTEIYPKKKERLFSTTLPHTDSKLNADSFFYTHLTSYLDFIVDFSKSSLRLISLWLFFKRRTSISPTFVDARKIGRPTRLGKVNAGKFDPAYPHLTKPVPLSHTITLRPRESMVMKSLWLTGSCHSLYPVPLCRRPLHPISH